ncbi:MAG: DUF3667 domain-containing protein [Cyclobacteriaceae bacterium]|nr:DUF3667 domain-containing protein [Cyclobacteriaceae bacterium]
MDKEICKNCSFEFSGFYCPSCGQKVVKTPLNFLSILNYLRGLFEFDKGFFHTFYILFRNPRILISDYLDGKSRPYNNPVRFYFSVIIFIYLTEVIYRFYESKQLEKEFALSDIDDQLVYTFNALNLELALFTVLFNYVFLKSKFNITEHIVIMLYQLSMYYFLTLISVLLFYFGLLENFAGQTLMILLIFVIFPAITFRFSIQVFKGRKILIIFKSILYYSGLISIAMFWSKL